MKELKPSGLFYVPVPMQYKKAEIINILMDAEGDNPYKLSEVWLTIDNYKQNVFSQKGQYYEIIGSVTADHIDFDPASVVESWKSTMPYDFDGYDVYPIQHMDYMDGFFKSSFSAYDSLRSLLTANDVHFVNPYKKPKAIDYGGFSEFYKDALACYKEVQSKLVEKILILKPL